MHLYILKPIAPRAYGYVSVSGPWDPWYNKAFGMVVRAACARHARELASEAAGAEGGDAWLDGSLSTCVELAADGDAGVIIQDIANA